MRFIVMRLDELLSNYRDILKTKWELPKKLFAYLKKGGFKNISGGTFCEVWKDPASNLVVKVGCKDTHLDGWIEFYKYIKTKQHNPNLPKVSKMSKLVNDKGIEFYVVVMEYLKPFSDSECKQFVNDGLYDFLSYYRTTIMKYTHKHEAPLSERKIGAAKFTKLHKDLANTIKDVIKHAHRAGFIPQIIDIHFPENIMSRNGVPVLIDPYGYTE